MKTPVSVDPDAQFEQEVRALLQMGNWRVEPEQILHHKRIDSYAEKVGDFKRVTRLAVECKNYASPLTQKDVLKIHVNYSPLLEKDAIDSILIVSASGLSPSAETYVKSTKNLIHSTVTDLQNSLLDLSQYAAALSMAYQSDPISRYYVPQRYSTQSPLYAAYATIDPVISNWIANDDPRPLALIAGYGMGKTTTARRLAHVLAEQRKVDASARLPVLIRLEDFGSEISLEGLLGKHFTALYPTPGYNFNLFMELNRRGRFVVMLDGFDEMAYAMSFSKMRYNFSQLNQLVAGRSKVILGGRPTAFLNDDERNELLHGRRRVFESVRQVVNAPDYHVIEMQPFEASEIEQVIQNYQRAYPPKADHRLRLEQLPSHEKLRMINLAARPVQLRMLLEIWPTWSGSLDQLTLTALYSEFIYLIIKREMDKLSRRLYSEQERREFARTLAVWMWNSKAGTSTQDSRIPDSLFHPYVKDDVGLMEARRDLLSACFVEVKHPDGYYFAHRSFQEFLIAETLVEAIESDKPNYEYDPLPTQEMVSFASELVGERVLGQVLAGLQKYRGGIAQWLAVVLLGKFKEFSDLASSKVLLESPVKYVLMAEGLRLRKWNRNNAGVDEYLAKDLSSPPHYATGESRAAWSRLLVVLNIVCNEQLKAGGIKIEQRLASLMGGARTLRQYVGKDVALDEVLGHHLNGAMSHIVEWGMAKDEFARMRLELSFGKSKKEGDIQVFVREEVEEVSRSDAGRPRRARVNKEHREAGIIKKKQFRNRH